MTKFYFFSALAIAVLAGGLFFPRSDRHVPTEAPVATVGRTEAVVRGMADFLEARQRRLAVTSPTLAPSQAPRVEPDTAEIAENAALAKRTIVESTEREIWDHYPATESGSLLRHYVALLLSSVDGDPGSELSRETTMTDLMADPVAAATDLKATLDALPQGAEDERTALLSAASRLGSDGRARAATEGMLAAEALRPSGLDSDSDEQRLKQVADWFASLEKDPARQADFLREAIQAQADPRVRESLQARLDGLTSIRLSQN